MWISLEFFNSVIKFFRSVISVWYLHFLSLCSRVVLLISVSIFMTNLLNPVSGKSFTSVLLSSFSEIFVLFFHLECIPLFLHFL